MIPLPKAVVDNGGTVEFTPIPAVISLLPQYYGTANTATACDFVSHGHTSYKDVSYFVAILLSFYRAMHVMQSAALLS